MKIVFMLMTIKRMSTKLSGSKHTFLISKHMHNETWQSWIEQLQLQASSSLKFMHTTILYQQSGYVSNNETKQLFSYYLPAKQLCGIFFISLLLVLKYLCRATIF